MCPILSYQNTATLTPVYFFASIFSSFFKFNEYYDNDIKFGFGYNAIHTFLNSNDYLLKLYISSTATSKVNH